MKTNTSLLTAIILFISISAFAQIKVASNGYVHIGSTATPAYPLDVNSGETRFRRAPEGIPLHIKISSMSDPKLCSESKIVFYRLDGTGFANIECQVCTEHSDSTAKENITPLDKSGLNTIEKLRGVSFNWKNDKDKRIYSGFLAQEVETVIPEAVFTNDTTNDKSIAYSMITPYLVEAIKEQQALIEELKSKVASIEINCCNASLKSASIATSTTDNLTENKARLDQNIPNPFSKETKIGCYIPEGSGASILYIYNMNGTQLQQYSINGKGNQSITINGNSFKPGMYLYALVIDGKEVDTKRMILTK